MNPVDRPPIPADLKRRVLVEAGHRCAIPTCRYIQVEIHHITPWGSVKEHSYENLIALCPNCHSRADRGEIDRKSLHLYKANLRFTHDRFSQFEVDFLFALLQALTTSPIKGLIFPEYLRTMVMRIDECGFIQWAEKDPNSAKIIVGGIDTMPTAVFITQKGTEYIASLSQTDLEENG